MRKGAPVTVYLSEEALAALDEEVAARAAEDKASGLTGYSVTNRSKLASEIVLEYLAEQKNGELTFTKISEIVEPVFARYGVTWADLFGSYARGDQTADSDIDIIIEKGQVAGLQFFRLQAELQDALGKTVNLQAYGADTASDAFAQKISGERKVLYAS